MIHNMKCFTAQSIPTNKNVASDDLQYLSKKMQFSRCGLNVCGERCARMEVHQVNFVSGAQVHQIPGTSSKHQIPGTPDNWYARYLVPH